MLKRVRVRRYKSLTDVEVHLRPLSVLFGPNAAGKSNFLDALQLLSGVVTRKTLLAAFDPPYRGQPLESFAFAAGGVEELLTLDTATFEIEVDFELSDRTVDAVNRRIQHLRQPPASTEPETETKPGDDVSPSPSPGRPPTADVRERYLRYRIEVEIMPKRGGLLRVKDEYLAALTKEGELTARRSAFIEAKGNHLVLRMEGQGHPFHYERHLDHSLLSLPMYAPHYPHVVAAQQELASWLFFYFEPRERMRLPTPIKEVRQIGAMGEELAAYLNTLRVDDEAQFDAIKRALRELIPSITDLDLRTTSRGEVELRIIENGVAFSTRVVSEGTLRILGLLALAAARDAVPVVGFEEPENGIQPSRVSLIATLLKTITRSYGRQLIVTTHSPDLIDCVDPSSLFMFRKRHGTTTVTAVEGMAVFARHFGRVGLDDSEAADADLGSMTIGEQLLRGDADD